MLVLRMAAHHFNQSTLFHTATDKYKSKEIDMFSIKRLKLDFERHPIMTQRS